MPKLRSSRSLLAVATALTLGVGGALVAAVPASAATVDTVDSFAAFQTAYQSSSATTVRIDADITGTSGVTLPTGKQLTLDLDGHALSVSASASTAALVVPAGTSLTIVDSAGGGTLTAVGGNASAAIGGNQFGAAGSIVIAGGTVTAKGSQYAAAIGSGQRGSVQSVAITGGMVRATGTTWGTGIGAGASGSTGPITISGGTVVATTGDWGAGIGTANPGVASTITISGGVVTATGGDGGAGIGTGYGTSSVGAISISHASVTATGGQSAAGIGGAWGGPGTAVTIGAGADVTATGGGAAASAIGPGQSGVGFGSLRVDGRLTLPTAANLIVPAGVTVPVTGTIVNAGTITLSGAVDGPVVNQGRILVQSGGVVDPATVTVHNFVVSIDPRNGSPVTTVRVYGASFTDDQISAPAMPVRAGYTFTGWFSAPTGGTQWSAGTALSGDTTIFAQWFRPLSKFDHSASVTVGGAAAVGAPLTATVTNDASPTPSAYTYQWSANGVAIAGATAATYTPTVAQLGATISVVATPVLDGYDGSTSTARATANQVVEAGTFTSAAAITLSGTPVVGGTLTATVTSDAIPTPTSYRYRWYADGTLIEDATGPDFTLTADQQGASITAEAVPVLDGYAGADAVRTSSASPVVAGAPFDGELGVSITGTAQVGGTLTAAVANGLQPTAQVAGYVWYRNGVRIAGVTGSSLELTASDATATITVSVSAEATGYATATATSEPVTVLAAPALTVSRDKVTAGGQIVVTGARFIEPAAVRLELHSTPVDLGTVTPDANGSFTVTATVPSSLPAGAHSIVALDAQGNVLATVAVQILAPTAATASGTAAPSAPVATATAKHARAALAFTGATVSPWLALVALLSVLVGAVLVVTRVSAARLRRSHGN